MLRFETKRELALRIYNAVRDLLDEHPCSDENSESYPLFFLVINKYTLHLRIVEYKGVPLKYPYCELFSVGSLIMPCESPDYPYWVADGDAIKEIVDEIYPN